jgi:hypothetical protein
MSSTTLNFKPITEVRQGQCAKLKARDGEPLPQGQTFAEEWDPAKVKNMLDAKYFLDNGGCKGPQTTVLPPGSYRLNMYLWEVEMVDATEIEKGFVGVVKSHVHSRVNFGIITAEKPESIEPIVDKEHLAAPIVEVGAPGIWNVALPPNLYYLNPDAYVVTPIETRIQTWKYLGGYTRREINLELMKKVPFNKL